MATYDFILAMIVISMMVILQSKATLTPKSPKGNNKDKNKIEKTKSGPQNYTVFIKKLVTDTPNSKDIIVNHGAFFKEVDEFSFPGLVLVYVTPVCYTFVFTFLSYTYFQFLVEQSWL